MGHCIGFSGMGPYASLACLRVACLREGSRWWGYVGTMMTIGGRKHRFSLGHDERKLYIRPYMK